MSKFISKRSYANLCEAVSCSQQTDSNKEFSQREHNAVLKVCSWSNLSRQQTNSRAVFSSSEHPSAMRTLKVAWDNCFARKDPGGSGVYAARLLEQFSVRSDLSTTIFNGLTGAMASKNGVGRACQTLGNMLWMHAGLPGILWKRGFDLLHAPAFLAPVVSPCPVVITIHDITYRLYPEHFAGWWVRYMNVVMPRASRSAAAIICGSEHSKGDIMKAYSVCGEKIHVIPYGVDHDRFQPGTPLDQEWARSLGIREGYLLHVGLFLHRKNIPFLLRVIAHLRDKGNSKIQLVLAGLEFERVTGASEIHRTIRELALHDNVVITGYVPDRHMSGLYAQAKLLVMPSLYEGFGFPILESMAAGTPVVASDTSSLPEVAGDAAILVSPTDENVMAEAIETILTKPKVAAELRMKGLARARQFTWQRTAAETVNVYRSVV
jgi:glycosyltransferase involved in cell wall biosynthesis